MTIETISLNRSHGGVQGVYRHDSRETGTGMTFSVYLPPHQEGSKLPVVWYRIFRRIPNDSRSSVIRWAGMAP
jgi:S-formylglutathione hydrolase FrmB